MRGSAEAMKPIRNASDGFGLAELHHLGAVLFRRALGRVLDDWLADDALSADDAIRFARMITADTARRANRGV